MHWSALRLVGEEPKSLSVLVSKEQLAQTDRRGLLRLRLLETRLAIELYRRAKGRWPERLEDLVPDHLLAVPGDPFASRGLVYRRDADAFVLYSVVPGGHDDGGRFNSDPTNEVPALDGFDMDWDFDRRIQAKGWPRQP